MHQNTTTTSSLLLVGLALGCGGRSYTAPESLGAGTAARDTKARTGLVTLPDPAYTRVRARFVEEEAEYRNNPDAYFPRGPARPCTLSPEFEATLIFVSETSSAQLTLLDGACVNGRFDGLVTYRSDWRTADITGATIVTGTYVDGKLDGAVTRRDRTQRGETAKILSLPDVTFAYEHHAGGKQVRWYKFGLREDDPDWHSVMIAEVSGDLRRVRSYLGTVLDVEMAAFALDGGIALHGPSSGMCFDFNRAVQRSSCTVEMSPTVGVPPDLMPGIKPQTMAEVKAEVREMSEAQKAAALAYIQRRGTTVVAAADAPPAQPASPAATSQPATSQPDTATRPAAPATTTATPVPAGKVAALCSAAANHQAGLVAPRDAKLREQLAKPIATSCKDARWSTERIMCVLDATDTAQLLPCEAMPAAGPEVKPGDPKACRAAAANQATLTAGGDASLQKSLASSIEKLCKKEKWSAARLVCVQAASTADAASRCSP